MSEISFLYYKDLILSIHCAKVKGKENIAKPLLLYAMFMLISERRFVENKFLVEEIKLRYEELQIKYNHLTPVQYPLYFLESDSLISLKWKDDNRIKTHTPSWKLIRENVLYVYFEEKFWSSLQNPEILNNYKSLIEENFLNL